MPSVEHGRQIFTGEFPFKGFGDLLIVALKRHQLLFRQQRGAGLSFLLGFAADIIAAF